MEEATSKFNGEFFSIYQFTGTAGCLFGGLLIHFIGSRNMFIVMSCAGLLGLSSLLLIPNIPAISTEQGIEVFFFKKFRMYQLWRH